MQYLPDAQLTHREFLSLKGFFLYVLQVYKFPLFPTNIAKTIPDLIYGIKWFIYFLHLTPVYNYMSAHIPNTEIIATDATPSTIGFIHPGCLASSGF